MKKPFIALLLSAAALAAALAAYAFFYESFVQKSETVAEIGNRITAVEGAASRTASVRTALVQLASDETTIRSYFVAQGDIVSFIENLEGLGRTLNAAVSIDSVSADNTGGPHPTLQIALSITGPFDAVLRTIGSIEYAPYALSLTKVSLSQAATTTWRADATLSVGATSADAAARAASSSPALP